MINEGEGATQQCKVEKNDKFKKGRQYNKRKDQNKKRSINKTSDKLHLVTLKQVEEVSPSHSDPTQPNHDDMSSRPPKRVFKLILDTLQRRDVDEIFAEPVDPNKVEDYYEIVKDPMDFGTMRAKLHDHMYQSLPGFEHDVFLIFKNAMHFNSSTTIFYKQARALNDLAIKLFHALKTDRHKLELELSTTNRRRSTSKIHDERKGLITRGGSHYSSLLNLDIQEDPFFTTMYPILAPIAYISQQEISYKESLMEFIKDLGPTAKVMAQRKLQESEASKLNDFIINDVNTKKKTYSGSCDTRRRRRRRRNEFNDKKIVLGMPATRTPRKRNSTGKSMEIIENTPNKMTKAANIQPCANEKCNLSDGHMKQRQELDVKKLPSCQFNNSFDLNNAVSMVDSYSTTHLFKVPWHHSYGMVATNTFNNGDGCGYQIGSNASNMGKEIYFKTTYLRSKFNGTKPCKIPK